MANGAIKGITIKLGADASELATALRNADKSLKDTQKQLNEVNKALKFNPNSVELLMQKEELLTRKIKSTTTEITGFQEALDKMKANGVSRVSDEYMAVERALIKAKSQQSAYVEELNQTRDSVTKVSNANNKFKRSLDNTKESVSTLQIACGNLVARGIEKLASAIMGSLDSALSRVDSLNNYSKTMQALGFTSEDATKAQTELINSIQNLPTALDSIVSVQQQYTALFDDIEKATSVTIALNDATLAGGQGAEQASRGMDAWYKIIAKGTPEQEYWQTLNEVMPAQMNQIAQAMLGADAKSADLFKAWQDGTVTTDQVTEALVNLDKNGGDGITSFAKQAETATGGIQTAIANLKTAITKGLANAIQSFGADNVTAIINGIKSALEKLASILGTIAKFVGDHLGVITALIVGIGTILGLLSAYNKIMAIWKALTLGQTAVQLALNAVLAMNPIALIIIAVTGLIAGLAVLYNKCEGFRNVVNAVWSAIKNLATTIANFAINAVNSLRNAFSSISSIGKNIVTGLWNGISDKFQWLVSQLKSFATNVKNKLKSFFGIKSPSKWARDMIGKNIDLGMAKGIVDNSGVVEGAMASLVPNMNVMANADFGFNYNGMYGAMQRAFADADFKIVLNDRVLGRGLREMGVSFNG